MLTIGLLTLGFTLLFIMMLGYGKRSEVKQNWTKYRSDPFYMMTAFLYKPDDDPRSRFEFMEENFKREMNNLIGDTLNVIIAPMLDVFDITQGGLLGGIGGVQAIQDIMKTMMQSFNKIFTIFENRYQATLFRLAMTFNRIQTSLERIWAVAVGSVYQSISTVSAILSTLDLIIKIIIIILVILVAIILFLFLFMWPVIPVALGVIGILVTAGAGAAVGGMAATFCFDGTTPVAMADGTTKPIAHVRLGDELAENCGKVTGCLHFQQFTSDLYELNGVRVTGSHIVWENGKPLPVSECATARLLPAKYMKLYCLNTTSNRIPIVGNAVVTLFSDWEELGTDDQMTWNRHVYTTLNPGSAWNQTEAVTEGEAAFHPATLVQKAPNEWVEISRIRPGDMILDELERPTRVLGVVELAGSEGSPSAVWRRTNPRACWKQGSASLASHDSQQVWYSLVTDHGTFRIITGESVRDFTDVGMHKIAETYDWVLDALGDTGKTSP
jgi:hypothetical protein